MLATERFIAVAISIVRIVPEEPTRVPATISATLSSAKPAAAAERPVSGVEQRDHDRHVGAADRQHDEVAEQRRRRSGHGDEEALGRICRGRSPITMQAATIPTSSTALITCWPGTRDGRVGIRSWSLAKAMLEPQKETEPITTAKQDRDERVEREARLRGRVRGGTPTRRSAPRRRRRRRCRGRPSAASAVICTRIEAITPTAPPTSRPAEDDRPSCRSRRAAAS